MSPVNFRITVTRDCDRWTLRKVRVELSYISGIGAEVTVDRSRMFAIGRHFDRRLDRRIARMKAKAFVMVNASK